MSRDLEYFTEFLADPSAYSFDEFFRWVREWGRYILDHKDEFNYLEDDEWKEIRERLIAEFEKREDKMDAVDDEWDEIGAMLENAANLSDKEKIELYERQIQFMKDYKSYFKFYGRRHYRACSQTGEIRRVGEKGRAIKDANRSKEN